MRLGYIPENIYKRSVDRYINKYNKDISKGAAYKVNCAFLCADTWQLGNDAGLWGLEMRLAFGTLINSSYAAAGKPASTQAIISFPADYDESLIRQMIEALVSAVSEYKLVIGSVQTKYVSAVNAPYVYACTLGEMNEHTEVLQNVKNKPKDIVCIGSVGKYGSVYLAEKYEELLLERYSPAYVRRMKAVSDLPLENISDCLGSQEVMIPISESGIFAALWELGSAQNSGLEVNLKQIPIEQEVVEVSDYFDINPYNLFSGNSILALVNDADRFVEDLEKKGISANKIGVLTDNNDKIVVNNEETRFLTKPEEDELYRVIQRKCK